MDNQPNDCPLNEPKCWAIDCNCKVVQSKMSLSEYNECPASAVELLADIETFKALRMPQEALKRIELYVEYRTSLLVKQNSDIREALGIDKPWPITDVLNKLVESTEYLLEVKNYDKVGWEDVSHCTKIGREMSAKIIEVINDNDMLPPGSAPIYTHSASYIESYREWLKSRDNEKVK